MKDSRGAIQDFNRAGEKQENMLRLDSDFLTVNFNETVCVDLNFFRL